MILGAGLAELKVPHVGATADGAEWLLASGAHEVNDIHNVTETYIIALYVAAINYSGHFFNQFFILHTILLHNRFNTHHIAHHTINIAA